jgi:hypothetical protein
MLLVVQQLLMILRYGRCIHHQVGIMRGQVRVIFIVYGYPFLFQLAGKRRGSFVIATDSCTMKCKIPCECAHPYPTDADEIDLLYIL